MDVMVLSKTDVARLLPLDACMSVMEETLKALSAGRATMPLRSVMPIPGGSGLLGLMPGTLEAAGVFGAKITSVYGSNLNSEFESHQGVVVLFEAEHGRPLALVDAGEVTAVRTAAVSGVATRVLAREDARTLALIGSGSQAHPSPGSDAPGASHRGSAGVESLGGARSRLRRTRDGALGDRASRLTFQGRGRRGGGRSGRGCGVHSHSGERARVARGVGCLPGSMSTPWGPRVPGAGRSTPRPCGGHDSSRTGWSRR